MRRCACSARLVDGSRVAAEGRYADPSAESNVPAKLVRYDPLKQTPMWSTPPTNKGRLEVTQYKGTTPKRFYMGYCLEVPKGRAVDCAPLKMAKCTGNKSQRWTHYGENIPASGPPEPAPGEESTEPYE